MQLLLRRFQGALRGAAIGEAVAAARDRFTWQQVKSGQWHVEPQNWQQQWPQSRLLIAAVDRTIAHALNRPLDRSPTAEARQPTSISRLDWLPIALFFHENPMLLRQQIDRLTGQSDAIEQACILALSEAIALALREELLIDQLLPRLSESVAPVSPIVSNQLLQVQAWLEAEASLVAVERSLAKRPVSLARFSLGLYGWLSTPQDFNLALLRMQRFDAAVWLGALAGAYQGMSGIAIDWWQPFTSSAVHHTWQTEILAPIDWLAAELLAAWAGADANAYPRIDRVGIAAAGLIRPR
ncbi:hypothetical protein H6F67_20880 [Microcoleus sp. FACHB-1515]|uniref:hypothetical protein n=1 Tax=Cyanophyceae TaxID=3028117 RepID=UPI0016896472|nr:hypothetical protein [Microcoleus sp. FACHB-1515]MBD2092307.1 hypothetical protein [Microcoleus sp. FACHB-1515]